MKITAQTDCDALQEDWTRSPPSAGPLSNWTAALFEPEGLSASASAVAALGTRQDASKP